jgi:RimJ/RimL family protein N-acetyltransferase
MSAVEITEADRGMIAAVLPHMRDVDRRELAAGGMELERLPDYIMRYRVFVFCAFDYIDGPIAIYGMVERRPGVGAAFAFGTDAWGRALVPMACHVRRSLAPLVRQLGYHRIEAAALAERHDVARFAALFGAEPEAVLRAWGCNREDFILYRWLDEHRSDDRRAQAAQDDRQGGYASH